MDLQEKIDSGLPVILLNECDEPTFEAECKLLIDSGYIISSTNCGFIDSEEYNYSPVLQAICIINKGEG